MPKKMKRHSILASAMIPMLAAAVIQFTAVCGVVLLSGTLGDAEDKSIYVLSKSGENRFITLKNNMVDKWSNIALFSERIEKSISDGIDKREFSTEELTDGSSSGEKKALLTDISEILVDMIRQDNVNGAFFILANGQEARADELDEMFFDGVYLRDSDPGSSAEDNADLIMERGSADIADKLGIPLDSFWTARYYYNANGLDGDFWNSYFTPYTVPNGSSVRNMGYWNPRACLYDKNKSDTVKFITYSAPVYVDGVFMGVIGTEIQYDYIDNFFPAGDAGNISNSGYMLLYYDENDSMSSIITATGSVFKRLYESTDLVRFESCNHKSLKYISTLSADQDMYASINELNLYNSNTEFSNEKWALAAVATNDSLFGGIESAKRNIFVASVCALAFSIALVYIAARKTTRPISDMVLQLNTQSGNTAIMLPPSGIYELDELSCTINNLSKHQQSIAAELREERERYLFAIESSVDIIIEYSLLTDILRIYHVTGSDAQSEMYYNSYTNFKQLVNDGKICHPDDRNNLIKLISGKLATQTVFRIIRYPNNKYEYLWFSCKVKPVFNSEGKLVKVIGSTRNITAEKEREIAAQDAVRRDTVTGLYNKEFGEKMSDRYIWSAHDASIPFALCIIDIDNFNRIESHYGMLFCDAVLSEVGCIISELIGKNDIAFRIGGDEIAILFAGLMPSQVKDTVKKISDAISKVYAGNDGAPMSISTGISGYGDGKTYSVVSDYALRALTYVRENRSKGQYAVYSELKNKGIDIYSEKYRPTHLSTVSKMVDTLSGNIVNFTFNIFEKNSDVASTINVMLPKLGRMFGLSGICIYETDLDYATNEVKYQWHEAGRESLGTAVMKINPEIYKSIEKLIGGDGTVIIGGGELAGMNGNIAAALGNPAANALMFVCAIYEKGKYAGAIVFERTSKGEKALFDKAETESLREIAKIFSTHISRSKSDLASRAKSEFLSRMSHEIRTPMNAIIGMTDIAKTVENDPVKINDCLDKIDISTKYLLSLINDILDMSRIESGKMHLEKGAVNLNELIGDIDTLIRPQAEKKNIRFEVKKNIRDNVLSGDAFRINQVLINLLGNAVKFTPEDGKIELSVIQVLQENDCAAIKFSVRDNGIGISKENSERIFNAFEQAEENTTRLFGGTGLGLAISSSIVRMMGSRLELNSEVGKGSDFFFTVRLPIIKTEAEAEKKSAFTITNYQGYFAGKRALLVEDNELNTEIAQYILKVGGFEVECAVNGKLAVDMFGKAETGYYDIILMDIRMPVMDGLEATREIRRLGKADSQDVLIVAMTANAFDDDMRKSIASGMNGHIAKPIDTPKLYALLDKLLFKK